MTKMEAYEQRILEIYNEYENLKTQENREIRGKATRNQTGFFMGLEVLLKDHELVIKDLKKYIGSQQR